MSLAMHHDDRHPGRAWPAQGAGFASTFLGGFECSTKVRADGRRLDLIASTGHGRFFAEDYRVVARHGLLTVRDGLRWHLIEPKPGSYDWSSFLPMLRAADAQGLQVIWDLCHYGWPDWLDIWSPDFVAAFANFARATAKVIGEASGTVPYFCTINEISYWAWAGGDVGRFAPGTSGRGMELKRQLVRASVAATRAIRQVEPQARFIHAEPLINVVSFSTDARERDEAERYRLSQYEAFDMVAGTMEPDLGGTPESLDIVGVNYYPDNQWFNSGGTVPLGHHAYRPLRHMLAEVYERYRRPLFLAETGAEGTARAAWLHYVAGEVAAARRAGLPVEGLCLYPILDYPGWDNDRPCEVGLLSGCDSLGRRRTDPDFAAELQRQRPLLDLSTPGVRTLTDASA